MVAASTLRRQIEATLSNRVPSALTPRSRTTRQVAATGLQGVDELLEGGLPLGAITEIVGPACSGHTSFALSFLAGLTQATKVCAWIDVSDELDPDSAAAAGVELSRLLWVRCGVTAASHPKPCPQPAFSLPEEYLVPSQIKKGLHGGGFGPHPRNEAKGLSEAISTQLQSESFTPRHLALQQRKLSGKAIAERSSQLSTASQNKSVISSRKSWSRIDQGLHVSDLLLQEGGFGAIVLDMCSIAPEHALRVPLATWFRYRAAAEQTQTSILLLTQHPCAKSSAELLLRLEPDDVHHDMDTVFTGIEHRLEVARRRFTQATTNVVSLKRFPQSVTTANWYSTTAWAGPR
jgi:recombination protein RecA